MNNFIELLNRRIRHAKRHVDQLKEKQGETPSEKFNYWGGWDMGYWKGTLSAYENTQDELGSLKDEIKKYREEIVRLRGKAHLSCPACHDDCVGWVTDGEPCREDWEL